MSFVLRSIFLSDVSHAIFQWQPTWGSHVKAQNLRLSVAKCTSYRMLCISKVTLHLLSSHTYPSEVILGYSFYLTLPGDWPHQHQVCKWFGSNGNSYTCKITPQSKVIIFLRYLQAQCLIQLSSKELILSFAHWCHKHPWYYRDTNSHSQAPVPVALF